MKFEKVVSPGGQVAYVAEVSRRRTDIRGHEFMSREAVRIIQEPNGWRIDRAESVAGAWMPWEAIVAVTYGSIKAAKAAIRDWVGAP